MKNFHLLRSVLIGTVSVAALANSAAAQAKQISVPSEDLKTALNDYIQQSGVQLVYSASDVDGLRSKPVRGALEPDQALAIMLDGTGIVAQRDPSGAMVVARPERHSDARPSSLLGVQYAQATPIQPAPQESGAVAEEVVVTGSRISSPGFETPTPVTSFSAVDLQTKAIATTSSLIYDIPQLLPNTAVIGNNNINQVNPNLRGLGFTRTLILVDGRRVAQTSPTGGFDMNVLPATLIKSFDLVTGGASAAYGSDAVAGVVSVTLDNAFTGIKGLVQGGESQYGDDKSKSLSLSFGTAFAGGRGHFVLSGDLYNSGPAVQGARPWGQHAWGMLTNPLYVAGSNNGQSRLLIIANVKQSQDAYGGLIVSNPAGNPGTANLLKGTQFLAGGQVAPFQYGQYVGTTFMVGGDGVDDSLLAPVAAADSRQSVFSHATYDITDDISGYIDLSYARSHQSYPIIPLYDNGDLTVSSGNPFLPAQVQSTMTANKISQFAFGRANLDMGFNAADQQEFAQRYAAGIKGKVFGDWNFEVYGQYANNRYLSLSFNNGLLANIKNSLDVVSNPAAGGVAGVAAGAPVCRSTLTAPTNGCVPGNFFGTNTLTPAVLNYVEGTSTFDETNTESSFAINVSGTPFSLWAGQVAVAFGAEYRIDQTGGTSDPRSQAALWEKANNQALAGAFNVKEAYLELDVPLLKNNPLGEDLDVDIAGRVTDYSFSGTVETWKIGLNYTPIEEFRFRATVSQDIRAPNINELYQTRGQNTGSIINPFSGIQAQSLFLTGGSTNLVPENGKTLTGGVVYQPVWLPGLQLSLDYYNIKITNAITTIAAQTLVNSCFQGQVALCSTISYGALGRDHDKITQVFSGTINAQQLRTDGLDLEGSYNFAADDLVPGVPGNITLRLLGNHSSVLVSTVNGVRLEQAGQTGNVPHYAGTFNQTYSNDVWTLNVQERYISHQKFNNTYVEGVDINNNSIPARLYVNATGTYRFYPGLQFFAKISNLFDVSPPVVPTTNALPRTNGDVTYDNIGRSYLAGIRFSF